MRKLLYVILIIDVASAVFGFFLVLSTSLLLAIIYPALALLGCVPIIAILSNMDGIEQLSGELARLRSDMRKINSEQNESIVYKSNYNNTEYKEVAKGVWECIKCGTVNKEGTDKCSNCGARYSEWINPTDSPYKKKKLSKWVK